MAENPFPQASGVTASPCFVVMPFGREPSEQRWFKGWFETVIKPAVIDAGYRPVLAAAEEQPGAINDEIRAHLALDPMVVVDLGGVDPDDDPNPNVMYELGIRHALGLPLVILAWAGQRLPFDVSNQRAIMEPRDMLSIEITKQKLSTFIAAAAQGKYYKPMEAVGRLATMEAASTGLTHDSVLTALVQEVRQLKSVVATAAFPTHVTPYRKSRPTIKLAIRSSVLRKKLYSRFIAAGFQGSGWARLLRLEMSEEMAEPAKGWDVEDWLVYLFDRTKDLVIETPLPTREALQHKVTSRVPLSTGPTEQEVAAVMAELPSQPWPKGTHQLVKNKLGISGNTYQRAVDELVRRGVFRAQVDGVLLETRADATPRPDVLASGHDSIDSGETGAD